ncbi:MAG: DUF2971 domain-containing protein, partial [Candidatus Korobacteraceae bacterium]
QHCGIVVEFDDSNPWFNQKKTVVDELRHLVKVAYVQNPYPRTWTQLTGADILYTKAAEWSYEREWRIIRPLKDGTEVSPGKFCFGVPAKAIRSIVLGCRTTPALEEIVRTSIICNPALSHVSFQRATLVGGKIKLMAAA